MRHFKYIFFLIISSIGLFANEYYFDLDNYLIDNISESNGYCKRLKKSVDSNICFKKSIKYVKFQKDYGLKDINKHILELKSEYDKLNYKDYANEEFWPATELYSNYDISVIAITKNTYTIKEDISKYLGGAHGTFNTFYYNYLKSGKLLSLDDLIIKGKKNEFIKIAKQEYLSQDKDGLNDWVEPKFFIPNNFIITNNGLKFLYNINEAKAYAFGQTSFFVPYSKLKNVLKSKYLLNGINKRWFYQSNVGYVRLKYKKQKNQINVDIDFNIFIPNQDTYITLSFPNLKVKNVFTDLKYSGINSLKLYPAGSKIFNFSKKSLIKAKYDLIEGHGKYLYKSHISFKVKKVPIEMLLRLTILNGKNHYTFMPSFSEVQDQQGFDVYKIYIK